jgi:hypothetical protein
MKHKTTVTDSIDRIMNMLVAFDNSLSRGVSLLEAREKIEAIKERLQNIQSLINSESDSWN